MCCRWDVSENVKDLQESWLARSWTWDLCIFAPFLLIAAARNVDMLDEAQQSLSRHESTSKKRSLKVRADEAETFWVLEVFLEFPNQFWTGSSGILCEKIHTYRFKPWLLYFFCYMQLNVMWSDIGLNRINNRPKKKKRETKKGRFVHCRKGEAIQAWSKLKDKK